MEIIVWALLITVAVVMVFFLPKWLFWISPHAYSVHDVLSEQYGRKTSFVIIAVTAAVMGSIFFLLMWGSERGW